MHIEDILARDIDRPVDGVVKASNNAQLGTEIEEYVITADLERHLTELLEAYTKPGVPESNGVWIAGLEILTSRQPTNMYSARED